MSPRKRDAALDPHAAAADEGFPSAAISSRWLLVLALSALVAFGSQTEPRLPHYGLLAAVIVSNAALALLRQRLAGLSPAIEVITISDVLFVTLAISWIDPSPQLYVAVFAALVLASALGRVGVIMLMMLLICGVYAGYLYTEVGPSFWRQVELILRVPFLYAVGLHFATVASLLKREKAERFSLAQKARQHAARAEHLAKEQDRLRALSQIGRLGLTAADVNPAKVLLEMEQRAQRALGATRCSLIMFEKDGASHGWGGGTKDRNIEVRTLPLEPSALSAILPEGKMAELHPGESKKVMARIKAFFPDSNPFGSLLAAPITFDDGNLAGGLFLIDNDHKRTYNDGERDFFWTVALMIGSFVQARERLENEVRLRTLIKAAPVIMFALGSGGTIRLFEGRGCAALSGDPAERIGESIFEVADNPQETREVFEQALDGKLATGTLSIEGTLFETQYSPLHGVDGKIAGVMGVTTAVLDAPLRAPKTIAAAAPQPLPTPSPDPESTESGPPPAAAPSPEPGAHEPPTPSEPPDLPQKTDPYAPREGLKPSIPLADEDPDMDTR